MRHLIWGVSLGERCAALAHLWAQSIRTFGRWRHPIVVLGDELARPLERYGVTVVDVATDARRIPGWHDDWAQILKPWILRHVDWDAYDYALYLDVDVLVTSDRLEARIEDKARRGVITVQRDILTISRNQPCTGRDTLTAAEKTAYGDEAICAGVVGVPGGDFGLGVALLADWWHASATAGDGLDQQHLIALLLRQYLGRWEYLGDTVIGRRLDHPECIQHFSNAGGKPERRAGRADALFRERFARQWAELEGAAALEGAP